MPSPGNGRARLEWSLRGIALAAMIVLAVRLWLGSRDASGSAVVTTNALDSALVAWSASAPSQVGVDATPVPDGRQRAWLVALRRTGTSVAWSTRDSSGSALVVEAGPLLSSPSSITALSTPGQAVVISDQLGRIDSTRAGSQGIAEWHANPISPVSARSAGSAPSAINHDSLVTHPVLVIGAAGWESKFVVAALEEDGWTVAARVTVAPGAIVRQELPARIDTGSVSAVVVLDSTSSLDAIVISRFVAEGGGLIAAGAGVNHPSLRAILASRVASTSAGEIGGLLGTTPREGLSARLFRASATSVPLERRGSAPVVVARRVGSGRVIAIGYDDTWRLRMTPAMESAPATHRAWWSSLVASAAYTRPIPRDVPATDEAPLAATIDALGPPVATRLPPPTSHLAWEAWLAALAAGAVLAEWLSRRLRGVA